MRRRKRRVVRHIQSITLHQADLTKGPIEIRIRNKHSVVALHLDHTDIRAIMWRLREVAHRTQRTLANYNGKYGRIVRELQVQLGIAP